jgi:hypothetical protein
MSNIYIDDEFEMWVRKNVVSTFEQKGIHVSSGAVNLVSIALQAQVEEKAVTSRSDLFQRAGAFSENILSQYQRLYGDRALTFNRALHLIVEWNRVLALFPTEPSV